MELPYIEVPPEPPTYKETVAQIKEIAPKVEKALNSDNYRFLDSERIAHIEEFRIQLESAWNSAKELTQQVNLYYANSDTKLSEKNPLKDSDGNPVSKEQLRQITTNLYLLLNRIRSIELNEIRMESRIRIVNDGVDAGVE